MIKKTAEEISLEEEDKRQLDCKFAHPCLLAAARTFVKVDIKVSLGISANAAYDLVVLGAHAIRYNRGKYDHVESMFTMEGLELPGLLFNCPSMLPPSLVLKHTSYPIPRLT